MAALEDASPKNEASTDRTNLQASPKTCLRLLYGPFTTFIRGWRTYGRQTVVHAGLALAFLYMTVVGFDSVTVGKADITPTFWPTWVWGIVPSYITGYIYGNGVTESEAGIFMSLAGVTGVLATFIYPCMRRRLGLEKTGVVAFSAEVLCLVLAVISIWLPGSPFDPHFPFKDSARSPNCSMTASTEIPLNVSTESLSVLGNTTEEQTSCNDLKGPGGPSISIIVFLVGVIASRTGV